MIFNECHHLPRPRATPGDVLHEHEHEQQQNWTLTRNPRPTPTQTMTHPSHHRRLRLT